jgi:CRISPR/Cas system-associated exonuclease Cas4 (RecB family)
MIELLKINQEIVFDEPNHKYFDKKGRELDAVSNVIGFYKEEFDPHGHITRAVAKRDGITTQQVRANWKKIAEDACIRGTNFHAQVEHYINTKEILDADYKDVVEQFSKIEFKGKLYSEIRLADTENKICGTADLIEDLGNNVVNLGDFKTNKKLAYKSRYGTKLMFPFNKYDECEFNIYTFQLNIYAFILKQNGYKVNNMTILYINPATRILEIHPVPNIHKEAEKMIKHYRNLQDW